MQIENWGLLWCWVWAAGECGWLDGRMVGLLQGRGVSRGRDVGRARGWVWGVRTGDIFLFSTGGGVARGECGVRIEGAAGAWRVLGAHGGGGGGLDTGHSPIPLRRCRLRPLMLDHPGNPPAPLDYSPILSARRRWLRRIKRWCPAGALLAVAILWIIYGPTAWRSWKLLRLQEDCLKADLPADRPVYIAHPQKAAQLLADRPGEYKAYSSHEAVRVDPRWSELAAALGIRAGGAGGPFATLFLHERTSPSGHRRLVVIESFTFEPVIGWKNRYRAALMATVIEPAGFGRVPKFSSAEPMHDDYVDHILLKGAVRTADMILAAGHPDSSDPSRFTIAASVFGTLEIFDGQLRDDDTVAIYLRDPAGYFDRRMAVWPRPSSRPSTTSQPVTQPPSP